MQGLTSDKQAENQEWRLPNLVNLSENLYKPKAQSSGSLLQGGIMKGKNFLEIQNRLIESGEHSRNKRITIKLKLWFWS